MLFYSRAFHPMAVTGQLTDGCGNPSCASRPRCLRWPEQHPITHLLREQALRAGYKAQILLKQNVRKKHSSREKNSQVMYSSTVVQFRLLLGYSSGRAVISDTIPPNSNTRRNKLLREFSRDNPHSKNNIRCESKRRSHVQIHERTKNERNDRAMSPPQWTTPPLPTPTTSVLIHPRQRKGLIVLRI